MKHVWPRLSKEGMANRAEKEANLGCDHNTGSGAPDLCAVKMMRCRSMTDAIWRFRSPGYTALSRSSASSAVGIVGGSAYISLNIPIAPGFCF